MTLLNATLMLYIFAQLADVWTTIRALRRPGTREGHPIIAWAMRHLGKNGWIILKLGIGAALGTWFYVYAAWGVLLIGAMLYGVVAYLNSTRGRR